MYIYIYIYIYIHTYMKNTRKCGRKRHRGEIKRNLNKEKEKSGKEREGERERERERERESQKREAGRERSRRVSDELFSLVAASLRSKLDASRPRWLHAAPTKARTGDASRPMRAEHSRSKGHWVIGDKPRAHGRSS